MQVETKEKRNLANPTKKKKKKCAIIGVLSMFQIGRTRDGRKNTLSPWR